MNRRQLLRRALQGGALAVAAPAMARVLGSSTNELPKVAPMVNRGRYNFIGTPAAEYSKRAVELVRRATVIDMLSPLWLSPSKWTKLLGTAQGFSAEDYARYKASGINVFHIAIGTGGPDAYVSTLKFISGWNNFLVRYEDWFRRIDSPERLDGIKQSGKSGVLLGVQNSEHFRTVEDVDFFFGLGQRVSQLTYNTRNMIGNGSTERTDEGLSDFGVSVVERMNKLGMVVDISHSGDKTTLDAFEVSKKPVLITHSNCRALNPKHPRCKTDEAIRKMAARGGVMGITGVRMFVSDHEPTTIETLLDHFDHVSKLVGPEHLGVGSDIDLDGYDKMPPEELKQLKAAYKSSYGFRDTIDIEGVNHPKRMFDLTEGLIRRGYSDANILGILGGNFQRVLKEIWTV